MRPAERRARLEALQRRFGQLPKRRGKEMPSVTELKRRAGIAWLAYGELVSRRPIDPVGAASTKETKIRNAHAHQLLRAVSFALTAGTAPEDIRAAERDELHQMFALEHPGHSQFGRITHVYRWHKSKHEDAVAVYEQLLAEGHL